MKNLLILAALLVSSSVFAYSTDKIKEKATEKVVEAKDKVVKKITDADGEELTDEAKKLKDKYKGKLEAKSGTAEASDTDEM